MAETSQKEELHLHGVSVFCLPSFPHSFGLNSYRTYFKYSTDQIAHTWTDRQCPLKHVKGLITSELCIRISISNLWPLVRLGRVVPRRSALVIAFAYCLLAAQWCLANVKYYHG